VLIHSQSPTGKQNPEKRLACGSESRGRGGRRPFVPRGGRFFPEKTLIATSSEYLADAALTQISPLDREIFNATAVLHANGLRVERQQLKDIIRHIGAD
jgi:hypothetical protein